MEKVVPPERVENVICGMDEWFSSDKKNITLFLGAVLFVLGFF